MRNKGLFAALLAILWLGSSLSGANAAEAVPPSEFSQPEFSQPEFSHGYSVFGELQYAPDFTHFNYANPAAPKGGALKLSYIGTFDTLNQFVVKGTGAYGLQATYDRLMANAHDELGASYGLIAQSVRPAPDHSWIEYKIRPEARWHDGVPISVDDIIFTLNIIKKHGSPIRRTMFSDVIKAEKVGPRTVRFTFRTPGQRKLSHTLGRMTVLPKHYWEGRNFEETTLDPPLTSGPYRIKSLQQGRSITYERVKDYWAQDLAPRRGQYNFDTITYDYFRDVNTRFEAFKSGDINYRLELSSALWAKGYGFDAVKSGKIVKSPAKLENPAWILALAINGRRKKFTDRRVRKAIDLAYDFDWVNDNFFHSLYARSNSYFAKSSLGASGAPQGRELELLEPWRTALPPRLFEQEYEAPRSSQTGGHRKALLEAMTLLKDAGWTIQNEKLTHEKTGEVFTIELIVIDALMERGVGPLISALKRLGIEASVRRLDSSQYFARITTFDFDIMALRLPQYPLPTRSLKDYWGSKAATRPGSYNYAGIKDPAVDAMLDIIATTDNEEDYFAAIKAVDRIMVWNHYMIPLFHAPDIWRAHSSDLKSPPWQKPMYDDVFPESWWHRPTPGQAVKAEQGTSPGE